MTFPKHTPNNVRKVQINVTNSPHDDLIEEGTLILVAGGVGWITPALFAGFLVVKHYNNLVKWLQKRHKMAPKTTSLANIN